MAKHISILVTTEKLVQQVLHGKKVGDLNTLLLLLSNRLLTMCSHAR